MFPLVIVVLYSIFFPGNSELVTIKQGVLNGTYLKTRTGKTFNAYYGIPFAEPPVGRLRLKAPVAAKAWKGVRNASITPERCIQNTFDGILGSEDCLYLNVYTPLEAKKGDNISVIVFIYGGVFKEGSNVDFGPNYILERNVILVMPNFREGVLGFLSTGDSVIPGNFALKDQTLALKWTQDNIYHFGGDPDKVTLQGHSSGATCVHLHTLSPLSKGLFQKVIIQSGNGLCYSSYFGTDVARAVAKELAERAGCQTHTSQDILNCIMSLDAAILPQIQEEMYVWDIEPDAAFRPSVESSDVENAFMTDFPENLKYHSPHLPLLIGLTTGESAYKTARFLGNDSVLCNEIDENYKLLYPITLQYMWNTKLSSMDYISQMIRIHYFKNESMSNKTSAAITDMYTNGLFGTCTIDVIYDYPGLKYVYWYDYRSNYSSQNTHGYYPVFLGVSHADEIPLIFYKVDSSPLLTSQDHMFGDELIKRWVNFVDTANPNKPRKINESIMGHWDPMSTNDIEYLYINLNGTMRTNLYKGTYQFWRSLPIKNKYL